MIQDRSLVTVTDNSGAKIGRIFKVLGGSKKRYARIGDLVVLSVQTAEPRKAVKKKEVCRAIVVRSRAAFRRKDGSYIKFDDNAVVLVDKVKPERKTDFPSVVNVLMDTTYFGRSFVGLPFFFWKLANASSSVLKFSIRLRSRVICSAP